MIKLYSVNDKGVAEIADFLSKNHTRKNITKSNLYAWVADAEFQLGEGNPPIIELKFWESCNKCTQTYTISENGLNCEIIEDNNNE